MLRKMSFIINFNFFVSHEIKLYLYHAIKEILKNLTTKTTKS